MRVEMMGADEWAVGQPAGQPAGQLLGAGSAMLSPGGRGRRIWCQEPTEERGASQQEGDEYVWEPRGLQDPTRNRQVAVEQLGWTQTWKHGVLVGLPGSEPGGWRMVARARDRRSHQAEQGQISKTAGNGVEKQRGDPEVVLGARGVWQGGAGTRKHSPKGQASCSAGPKDSRCSVN